MTILLNSHPRKLKIKNKSGEPPLFLYNKNKEGGLTRHGVIISLLTFSLLFLPTIFFCYDSQIPQEVSHNSHKGNSQLGNGHAGTFPIGTYPAGLFLLGPLLTLNGPNRASVLHTGEYLIFGGGGESPCSGWVQAPFGIHCAHAVGKPLPGGKQVHKVRLVK
jgi:hypothetical protein